MPTIFINYHSSSTTTLSHPLHVFTFPSHFHTSRISSISFPSSKLSSSLSHSSPSKPTLLETNPPKLKLLFEKMDLIGIVFDFDDPSTPGKYYCLLCPKCKGGRLTERSLSFHIMPNGDFAMWRCFQSECGWAGRIFADGRLACNGFRRNIKFVERTAKESLILEPLGDELISYFSKRMISPETLERNVVMQIAGRQGVIAFTYRQNGQLVGCKYRTMDKRFWQEKGTEKLLYGIDDIIDADEVIIVEGELDKLSVEEAGFRNCISVPGGAPGKVSTDTLPSIEKDTAYQYLWSCKDYLDKVSRFILATDSDGPGQALAEELARRLGRDRCWRVYWPHKDDFSHFKDANEVLEHMGPDALKRAIQNAELYLLNEPNKAHNEEDINQELVKS